MKIQIEYDFYDWEKWTDDTQWHEDQTYQRTGTVIVDSKEICKIYSLAGESVVMPNLVPFPFNDFAIVANALDPFFEKIGHVVDYSWEIDMYGNAAGEDAYWELRNKNPEDI